LLKLLAISVVTPSLDFTIWLRKDVGQPRSVRATNYAANSTPVSKSVGVVEFDLNGVVRDANENFSQIVGSTIDELRGEKATRNSLTPRVPP